MYAYDSKKSKTLTNKESAQFRSLNSETGKSTASRFTGGRFAAKNTKTPSLKNAKSNASRITTLLQSLGAIGQNGLSAAVIRAKFNETFGTNKTQDAINAALTKMAAKMLVFARPSDASKNITLYSLPDGSAFFTTAKTKPSTYAGGSQVSLNSTTPSLKRPDSRFNRILAILREKPGLSTNQITTEYNKRHGTDFNAGDLQPSRLAAKGIIRGEASDDDARVTLWFLK